MDSEPDFQSLPLKVRLVHKNWKARQSAYEELAIQFKTQEPESEIFKEHVESIKDMVLDNNAVAQEAGLSAVSGYIDNGPKTLSLKHRKSIVSTLIEKSLASTRTGTRNKAIEILLTFVEIDDSEPVLESAVAALGHKNPKNVAATFNLLKEMVSSFGVKIINTKLILKQLSKGFDHKDKGVRDEAFSLSMELYSWIGSAISVSLSDLKPVQIKYLNEEFEKITVEPKSPSRQLRSQTKQIKPSSSTQELGVANDPIIPVQTVDPFEFLEETNILDHLPKSFYEILVSPNWKERKEILEALIKLFKTPKLQDGKYGELLTALGKRLQDANIVVVILSAQSIDLIAKGLRSDFYTYFPMVLGQLLDRCKEKKQSVIDMLRNTLDSVFISLSLSNIIPDLSTAISQKNPQIKSEAIQWLIRCIQVSKKIPVKPDLKLLVDCILKGLDDSDGALREFSAEALGSLMKFIGEKQIQPFIEKLDSIKKTKIKEYFTTASVHLEVPLSKTKVITKTKSLSSIPDKENNPPIIAKKNTEAAIKPKGMLKKATQENAKPKNEEEPITTSKFSDDSALGYLSEFAGESIFNSLSDLNWKVRLEAINQLSGLLESKSYQVESEAIMKSLMQKPGWKESNFQIMNAVIKIFSDLCVKCDNFNKSSANHVIPGLTEKLGDIKVKKLAGECLVNISDRFSFSYTISLVYDPILKQKSPKIITDALQWICDSTTQFGVAGTNLKALIDFIKTNMGNTNQSVRSKAISLFALVHSFAGPNVRNSVQDLSPSILSVIDAELAKNSDTPKPVPVRAQSAFYDNTSKVTKPLSSEKNINSEKETQPTLEIEMLDALVEEEETFPRTDISARSSEQVVEKLGDPNWKIRKEALDIMQSILQSANNKIKPNLGGDFVAVFKSRFSDSNKFLVIQSLELCGQIAVAMGKPFEKYVRTLLDSIIGCLSDQKVQVRAASIAALDSIFNSTNIECMIPSLSPCLLPEHSMLRKELLTWLSSKLEFHFQKSSKKLVDFEPLLLPLLTCLLDKMSDVRKLSGLCLNLITKEISLEEIKLKAIESFKGAILQTINTALDAFKPQILNVTNQNGVLKPSTPEKTKIQASTNLDSTLKSSRQEATKIKPKQLIKQSSKKEVINPNIAIKQETLIASNHSHEIPLVSKEPRDKQIRAERNIGLTKWVFETPRKDLLDFLEEQCDGNFSPELISLLFSTDHYKEKYFLQGMTLLDDSLSTPAFSQETFGIEQSELKTRFLANSDLILKYISIRLFDTNTTMLIKSLDLIEHLFSTMDEMSYTLSEYEASSFLPYFINKAGDSKESMRLKIRGILRQICRIYPASKMFSYILEGLKSKNSRTRVECLDEIATLIQRNGIGVCSSKAFVVIAAQISDRDATVRNAALNVFTQVYLLIGEGMYKFLGKIPDKEKSLLDEKLKRLPTNTITTQQNDTASKRLNTSPKSRPATAKDMKSSSSLSFNERLKTKSPEKKTLEFRLDLDELGIPKEVDVTKNISQELNPSEMYPPLSSNLNSYKSENSDSKDEIVNEYFVAQLTDSNLTCNLESIKKIEKKIQEDPASLENMADDIVGASISQLNSILLSNPNNSNSNKVCRYLMHLIAQLFSNPRLAQRIKRNTLYICLQELLIRMHDPILSELDGFTTNPANPTISKNMSSLIIRILDTANKNDSFSVILELLERSVCDSKNIPPEKYNSHSKYMDAVMRCLWKLTKLFSTLVHSVEFRLSDLIFEIHQLLTSLPPTEWKKRGSESPMPQVELAFKSIKTMLHELVTQLKEDIFNYVDKLSDPPSSPAVHLIRSILDSERRKQGIPPYENSSLGSSSNIRIHSAKNVPAKLELETESTSVESNISPHSIEPIQTAEMLLKFEQQLSSIFQKISNKDITKLGIQELFKFQLQHPDQQGLIETFMNKTGTYFQGYIRRGLANLANERISASPAKLSSLPEAPKEKASDLYKEKLAKLQRMFVTSEHSSPIKNPEPIMVSSAGGLVGYPEPDKVMIESKATAKTQTVADLRERLTRMKLNLSGKS